MLPTGITSSNQLVWYRQDDEHDNNDTQYYYPCRICEPAEALHIRLDPNSWDRKEVTLVQVLDGVTTFHGGHDRLLVNTSSLRPYHENDENGNSTKWSETLWKQYAQQRQHEARRAHKHLSSTDLLTCYYLLDRILQTALARDKENHDNDDTISSSDDDGNMKQQQCPYNINENNINRHYE